MRAFLRSLGAGCVLASLMAIVGIVAGAGDSWAGQVDWSSERLATNVTSGRSPLGSGFQFELGGFSQGFVPRAENIAEWRAHWVPVGSADYNVAAGFFAASTAIEALPATVGRTAYIWGFDHVNVSVAAAEWILVTDPGWQFPVGGSAIAPPSQWSTGTAAMVIVGSVNAVPGIHLQTAAVGGGSSAAAGKWLANHGLDHADDSHIWETDSDGDGATNLMEYMAGTHPLSAASVTREPLRIGTRQGGAVTLTFDKNPEVMVDYRIEISSDLSLWRPVAGLEVVSELAGQVTVRVPEPDGASAGFFRLRVSLPD